MAKVVCTLILGLLAVPLTAGSSAERSLLQTSPSGAPVEVYDWHVTAGIAAPDCFEREVILVNGEFQPTLEVAQGTQVEITVHNDLSPTTIDTANGISIHWHGFSLVNNNWYDGSSYSSQCPIPSGSSFTYRFIVNEPVGTYMWHDHSQLFSSDGLQGALIVRPREGAQEAWDHNDDFTLFLSDWYHAEGNDLGITLQRPFDLDRTTPDSGLWRFVSLPQALLINGKGFYGDCTIPGGLGFVAGNANYSANCSVEYYAIPSGRSAAQPQATPFNPGCGHANFTVEEGGVYRFRLVANAMVAFTTVCFEGHNVTVIATDATPVDPIAVGECVDVASGQRVDVELTADQPADNYWITLQQQYRIGGPNGYAILHYEGAENFTLPEGNQSQPNQVKPWTLAQVNRLKTHPALINPESAGNDETSQAIIDNFVFPPNTTSLAVPPTADRVLAGNITQPLLTATGQLRWALNNIVQPASPPCRAVSQIVVEDPSYIADHLPAPDFDLSELQDLDAFVQVGSEASDDSILAWDAFSPMPAGPVRALHVLQATLGQVIDIVVQNNKANAFGGDYRNTTAAAARNGSEAHPFHMHGHHFWLLATGNGTWNASSSASYNLEDPAYRDTLVVPASGWAALRFLVDNPGVWPFHCHLNAHLMMGQSLFIVESPELIPPVPIDMPVCRTDCVYQSGPFNISYVAEEFPSFRETGQTQAAG